MLRRVRLRRTGFYSAATPPGAAFTVSAIR
jgi:hypothetical protein